MSSEGFGYEEKGAGTSSAGVGSGGGGRGGRGTGKPMGREIRHRIKAPSWPMEALAGRVLSGGQGPTCARWRSRMAGNGVGLPPIERPL